MPKVSICIPAYNQVKYLKKTVDSVLGQSYTDYEIIVTDDSTSMDVAELIQKYNLPEKIRYFRNINALGSPENWNAALDKATGDYIKILHHDDWFTDESSLSEFVKVLDENPGTNFAFSAATAISVKNKTTWLHSATSQQLSSLQKDPNILFFGNFIGPPSSTIHRKNDNIRYDKNLKWVVDFDYYIHHIKLNNNQFIFLEKPLITSISGDQHNVTNQCENNAKVEIFEYLYLFNKLNNGLSALNNSKKYLIFLSSLISKYNIRSLTEIKESGYQGSVPLRLHISMIKNKMKNVFRKK